jgi:hypothetical protein
MIDDKPLLFTAHFQTAKAKAVLAVFWLKDQVMAKVETERFALDLPRNRSK